LGWPELGLNTPIFVTDFQLANLKQFNWLKSRHPEKK
jgi:hypothetical protein